MGEKPWHQEARLREMYFDEGKSQEEIAEYFGINQTSVSYWFDEHGIDTTPERTKKLRNEEWVREQYWGEGKSTTEIADELGCSDFAVCEWMREHGIERRVADHEKQYVSFYTRDDGYEHWSTKVGEEAFSVYVHRLLMVAEQGMDAVRDMVVHHKNEIPWDNRAENLQLMGNREHSRHHA